MLTAIVTAVLAAAIGQNYVWISPVEIMALPTSGSAWEEVFDNAQESTARPNLSENDDLTDVRTLAKAYVYVRTGQERYRAEVIAACMAAIETENGGRTLALARNLVGYVVAAQLVGLPAADDTRFRSWLDGVRTETLSNKTLISTHEVRPNNWGTHAGASRMAADLYLGDMVDFRAAAKVFHGWLGDRSAYTGFKFHTGAQGAETWSCLPILDLVSINPANCVVDGHDVSGALIDDISRGAPFQWPPAHTGYVWSGLSGAIVQAEILHRQGFDAWNWEDQALKRAYLFLYDLHEEFGFWWDEVSNVGSSDDSWQPWLFNHRYGLDLPTVNPTRRPGKQMGFTNWTHAGAPAPLPPPPDPEPPPPDPEPPPPEPTDVLTIEQAREIVALLSDLADAIAEILDRE